MDPTRHLHRIIWIALVVFLTGALLVASIVFLNPSSVGNRRFLWNLELWAGVWSLVFVLLLVLTVVLARHIIHAFFEIEAPRRRSSMKSRLVLTFAIFSIFPALIMAFLAFGLINQNLSTWMSAPADQLIGAANRISVAYYSQLLEDARRQAADLSRDIAADKTSVQLEQELLQSGFEGLVWVDLEGSVRRRLGNLPDELPQELLAARNLPAEEPYLEKSVNLQPGMEDRIWIPVAAPPEAVTAAGTWWFLRRIPQSVAFDLTQVQEAYDVLPGLKGSLASLRITYLLILVLTTLTVVFGFVWLGGYIARRLSGPLEALAKGSQQLAAGNLAFRIPTRQASNESDELQVVIHSFNRMADELQESRDHLQAANEELRRTNLHLEERRKYIETILQNIATGVLTFDDWGILRTVNAAAAAMLQRRSEDLLGRNWREVLPEELRRDLEEMQRRARLYGSYRRPLTIERSDGVIHVAATMTATANDKGHEMLLVFDDLTELIRAERFAAWQEVARRLAHEIKNPLTPIQLSTERIQRRFRRLETLVPYHPEVSAYGEVLASAAQIIHTETRLLRNLLAEFSRFARLPISQPRPIRLHDVIGRSLDRYRDSLASVQLECRLDSGIDRIEGDPEQLQRVFSNLLDNALDALAEEQERRLIISTVLHSDRNTVTIEVADNGPGIAVSDQEQLFLPYFSTKRKGTGLGLAIVRQIVGEHHGNVRAEPNRPRGTRIIMELPLSWKSTDEGQTVGRG